MTAIQCKMKWRVVCLFGWLICFDLGVYLFIYFHRPQKIKKFDRSLSTGDGDKYTLTSIGEALVRAHEIQSTGAASQKPKVGRFSCSIEKRIIMKVPRKGPGKLRLQGRPQDSGQATACYQSMVQKYKPANVNTWQSHSSALVELCPWLSFGVI